MTAELATATFDSLAALLRDHPGVNAKLSQSSAPVMVRQLAAGEVDVCLASQPLPGPHLRSVEIRREGVLLAVSPRHPLAGRSEVGIPTLAGEPFVTTRPGYWQRSLLDRLFGDAGLEPVIACEGDEPAGICSLISAGLGIGLLPAVAYEAASGSSVAWLRIDTPDCHRVLRLVRRDDDGYFSATARSFRDVATEHFRTTG
ncbi:LysR substrate-binding domain-containing protein [Actinoallomurus sp. NPDC052308]|uniref:LysR substrate-binding domain-containing protein n=1 Tax=Actinoallomurus sp. NPDC052308 TaxID=3155530 RepID=UPI00342E075E